MESNVGHDQCVPCDSRRVLGVPEPPATPIARRYHGPLAIANPMAIPDATPRAPPSAAPCATPLRNHSIVRKENANAAIKELEAPADITAVTPETSIKVCAFRGSVRSGDVPLFGIKWYWHVLHVRADIGAFPSA